MMKPVLLIAFLCLPVAAEAQERAAQQSLSISYADLDLSSSSGERSLRWRVEAAITRACDNGDEVTLAGIIANRHCADVARSSVEPQISAALAQARDRMRLASK